MIKIYISYNQMDQQTTKQRDNFVNQFDSCIADDINKQFILIKDRSK